MLWLVSLLGLPIILYFLLRRRRKSGAGIFLIHGGNVTAEAAKSAGMGAFWTFPTVVGSSIIIAWGAEVGEFLVSQGMALAILAWLQVLPEFAVEAAITYNAAQSPDMIHLITANFTGSNRLLVGLGWPLIFFTAYITQKGWKKGYEIVLREDHSVEVVALLIPTLYFVVIYLKATITLIDSAVLIGMYMWYLRILSRLPPEDMDKASQMHGIPKYVLTKSKRVQAAFVISMFMTGGIILFFVAEPFLNSMLGMAIFLGLSPYLFIQWVAPFLSEFPEKTSAFYWARTVTHAPMAMMNMISSKINQWTILVGMIPIVFSSVRGDPFAVVPLDPEQNWEVLLTIAQSAFGVAVLMKMRFTIYDASAIFGLWFFQFLLPYPEVRHIVTVTYFAGTAVILVYHRKELRMFRYFRRTLKRIS